MVFEKHVRLGEIEPARIVERRVSLQHRAGEEELRVKRIVGGRIDSRPEREQLDARILAGADPLFELFEMGDE